MQPDHMDRRPSLFHDRDAPWPARRAQLETDVGVFHIRAAYETTAGGPGLKAVLACMADRACDVCGLAWPGIPYLAERTEIPERRVSAHLAALKASGLIAVHGYSTGGRGRTTEYIVLPQVSKLSTAPCEKCGQRRKTLSPRAVFTAPNPVVSGGGNPVATDTPSISIYPSVDPSAEPSRKPGHEPGRSEAPVSADGSEPAKVPQATLDFLASLGVHPPTASEGKPTKHPPRG